MPDITPYNYYILYAAIAMLVVTLILSLLQMARCAKDMLAFLQPKTDKLQRDLKIMQIKMDVMNEKKAADAKKNKYILLALPILLAVYQAYQKDDEAVGAKGVVKAAKAVYENRASEAKLIKKVAAAIR